MITALENLEVRAAGKRGFDADADFARFERGRRDIFDLNVFLPVKDGGFHRQSLTQTWFGFNLRIIGSGLILHSHDYLRANYPTFCSDIDVPGIVHGSPPNRGKAG
jgi:hypothetical protein